MVVQPELDESEAAKDAKTKGKLKPEIAREMYFECINENYEKVPG